MFDSKEIAERALLRAELIKARRKRERLKIAALLTGVSALAACFILLPVGYGGTDPPPAQGSVRILDGAVAGGHVLAGVIGFILGVVVTVQCLRGRR